MFIIDPTTISGKVRLRTPLQANALSGRYIFNNLQNTEPNLGIPKPIVEQSPDPDGRRYFLLSNNSYSTSLCSVSAWRVWSYNSPTIATWTQENSIAIGDYARPIRKECLVYNNYLENKNNRYNSEGFFDKTFNVFSVSGIYLFDPTTVGDPASATSFIVTNIGNVGVNTELPNERLSISGNLSCNGNITCTSTVSTNNLNVSNESKLGNSKIDDTIVRGELFIGDGGSAYGVKFGDDGTNYDCNLYRLSANILKTDDLFVCTLSTSSSLSAADVLLTNANVQTFVTPVTASGDFLILNINGTNRALRLWDY